MYASDQEKIRSLVKENLDDAIDKELKFRKKRVAKFAKKYLRAVVHLEAMKHLEKNYLASNDDVKNAESAANEAAQKLLTALIFADRFEAITKASEFTERVEYAAGRRLISFQHDPVPGEHREDK